MAAKSEASETYRELSSTRAKTPSVIHIVIGVRAKSTPADVLTPFPPLKPAQTGYMCPMTAATPARRRTTVSTCQAPMPAGSVSNRIVAHALRRGVFFYGGGTGEVRDIVCMGPPFIIEDEHIDTMVRVLVEAVNEVTGAA